MFDREHIEIANDYMQQLIERRRKGGQLVLYLDIASLAKNMGLEPWLEHVIAVSIEIVKTGSDFLVT